jgi:flagellin
MGGRDQEMTFGIGKIDYTALYGGDVYGSTERTVSGGPNDTVKFHLKHLPSDAVAAKTYGAAAATGITTTAGLAAGKTYVVTAVGGTDQATNGGTAKAVSIATGGKKADGTTTVASPLIVESTVKVITDIADVGDNTFKEVGTDNFVAGFTYEVVTLGASFGNTATGGSDAHAILDATTITGGAIAVGDTFSINSTNAEHLARLNSLVDGATFRVAGGSNLLTQDIEAIQGLVNTARVQAGSQYAALESAVNYTTDLTAQYELGYNTVNDVNFSMETAHLAKNQILQQAATAMLAQANQGQQGLLQLIS